MPMAICLCKRLAILAPVTFHILPRISPGRDVLSFALSMTLQFIVWQFISLTTHVASSNDVTQVTGCDLGPAFSNLTLLSI